mgnify:CR=1 FL=1
MITGNVYAVYVPVPSADEVEVFLDDDLNATEMLDVKVMVLNEGSESVQVSVDLRVLYGDTDNEAATGDNSYVLVDSQEVVAGGTYCIDQPSLSVLATYNRTTFPLRHVVTLVNESGSVVPVRFMVFGKIDRTVRSTAHNFRTSEV